MIDFARLAENLSFLLDDLNIPGTAKLSGEELALKESDGLTGAFRATCSILLTKLNHHDQNVLTVPMDASVSQIFHAFKSRMPNFTPDTVNAGPVPELLQFRILHFLCTNLQAERLSLRARGGMQRLENAGERGKIVFQLDKICRDLKVDVTQEAPQELEIISAIREKIVQITKSMHPDILRNPPRAINATAGSAAGAGAIQMSKMQQDFLSQVNNVYYEDFLLRRRMLLTRLDVTIQTFLWGERSQGKEGEIVAAIQAQRKHLTEQPHRYSLEDVFEAPVSLLHEHAKRVVDSSGKSLVKTVIIGAVPDRGGRANEMRPKKADIFGFNGSSGGGRGGRGGNGGGRGGGRGR